MRKPAVAGMFYPAEREELKSMVRGFLAKGKPVTYSGELKALIVPHAGYIYSGSVAGSGFRLLKEKKNRSWKSAVLLGPSHHAYLTGAAIAAEDFETPLGVVRVGDASAWTEQGIIRSLPEAHSQEHSLEVELPFLQETIGAFELYALVLGEVDEQSLAEAVSKHLDDDTIIIVSSDLSHYKPYAEAVRTDKQTIRDILDGNLSSELDACGSGPVRVLMHLAKKLGWKPFLIEYRNSGDVTGDRSGVVGYCAIGYSKEMRHDGARHDSGRAGARK